jgi:signal transduction histidine kinase
VIGFAEELRDAGDQFDRAERDEMVSLIAEQAIDVGNIVEDLLVAARADIGRIAIDFEPVVLLDEVMRVLPQRHSQDFALAVDPAAVAAGDRRRIRQILRNLITNAVRYGGDRIEVGASSQGGTVTLEVCDDGPGIPEELREKVFEPYQTAHTVVGVTGSVGLGLTVSRQLARLMGGDLAYDRRGDRTVFRLSLPALSDGEFPGVPGPSAAAV